VFFVGLKSSERYQKRYQNLPEFRRVPEKDQR
jgi:hypothetical protein